MNDILTLLSENPHILDINSNIDRNQGSYTSYVNDPPVPPLERSVSRSYEIKEKAEKDKLAKKKDEPTKGRTMTGNPASKIETDPKISYTN